MIVILFSLRSQHACVSLHVILFFYSKFNNILFFYSKQTYIQGIVCHIKYVMTQLLILCNYIHVNGILAFNFCFQCCS